MAGAVTSRALACLSAVASLLTCGEVLAQVDEGPDARAPVAEPAPGSAEPGDAPAAPGAPTARRSRGEARVAPATRVRARARHDVVLSWAPRHRLDTTTGPLGLEQQLWRRVETLPLYHRVTLDATGMGDGLVSLHFAGWGALDLFADSSGQVAAGDVAIGYVELSLEPVRLWAGRRYVTYGPPGGLHVDGGGASVTSSLGLSAEAFVGRPVTPVRTGLVGPVPSFDDAAVAYGARVGWAEPGTAAVAVGYAELWGHGITGSRTVDVAAYWDPGELRLEGATKIDVLGAGVAQARVGAAYRIAPEVAIDADYLHVEPGRWIPPWSILSVFDTSTFDEAGVGSTVRPVRGLALRAELAGRLYSSTDAQPDEPRFGYRGEVSARVVPMGFVGPRVRVLASRRDDGTIGYTLVQAGAAFDPIPRVVVAVDASFGMDDSGARQAMIGRASADWDPAATWKVGLTLALARTPIAAAETRAMLRVRWTPEVP